MQMPALTEPPQSNPEFISSGMKAHYVSMRMAHPYSTHTFSVTNAYMNLFVDHTTELSVYILVEWLKVQS